MQQILGFRSPFLQYGTDTKPSRIERNREAEDEEQHHGQDKRDQDTAGVSNDLYPFFANQRPKSARSDFGRLMVHGEPISGVVSLGGSPYRRQGPQLRFSFFSRSSNRLINSMNASSMVGLGSSAVLALCFSASGESSAISLPR